MLVSNSKLQIHKGSLSQQDDDFTESTQEEEKERDKVWILLIISSSAFGGYKTYKYWWSKTLGWLGNF